MTFKGPRHHTGLACKASLLFSIFLGLAVPSLAQDDFHAQIVPEDPAPPEPEVDESLIPTITEPELFYREAWEKTARLVNDPSSREWFTVILADLPAPDGEFQAYEWLSTHAAEKLESGVFIFPARDGSVKIGAGVYMNLLNAIKASRERHLQKVSGLLSPLIQQLGPMASQMPMPTFAALAEGEEVPIVKATDAPPEPEPEPESAPEVMAEGAEQAPEPVEEVYDPLAALEPGGNSQDVELRQGDSLADQLISLFDTDAKTETEAKKELASETSSEAASTEVMDETSAEAEGPGSGADSGSGSGLGEAAGETAEPDPASPPPANENAQDMAAQPLAETEDAQESPQQKQVDQTEPDPAKTDKYYQPIDELVSARETRAPSLDELVQPQGSVLPKQAEPNKPALGDGDGADAGSPTVAIAKPAGSGIGQWPPEEDLPLLMSRYQATQSWLRTVQDQQQGFSVQLAYLLSERAGRGVNDLIAAPEMAPYRDELLVYRTRRHGKEALVLSFGSYLTRESALKAIKEAPESLHGNSYQVRPIAAILDEAVLDQ